MLTSVLIAVSVMVAFGCWQSPASADEGVRSREIDTLIHDCARELEAAIETRNYDQMSDAAIRVFGRLTPWLRVLSAEADQAERERNSK